MGTDNYLFETWHRGYVLDNSHATLLNSVHKNQSPIVSQICLI